MRGVALVVDLQIDGAFPKGRNRRCGRSVVRRPAVRRLLRLVGGGEQPRPHGRQQQRPAQQQDAAGADDDGDGRPLATATDWLGGRGGVPRRGQNDCRRRRSRVRRESAVSRADAGREAGPSPGAASPGPKAAPEGPAPGRAAAAGGGSPPGAAPRQRLPLKRGLSRQHPVQHAAQAEQVARQSTAAPRPAPAPCRPASPGRAVLRQSSASLQRPGQTEVEDLDPRPRGVAPATGCPASCPGGSAPPRAPPPAPRPSRARSARPRRAVAGRPLQSTFQRLALEERHHQERHAGVLIDLMDGDDVIVFHCRRRPRLAEEAPAAFLVARDLRPHHFHRHLPAEGGSSARNTMPMPPAPSCRSRRKPPRRPISFGPSAGRRKAKAGGRGLCGSCGRVCSAREGSAAVSGGRFSTATAPLPGAKMRRAARAQGLQRSVVHTGDGGDDVRAGFPAPSRRRNESTDPVGATQGSNRAIRYADAGSYSAHPGRAGRAASPSGAGEDEGGPVLDGGRPRRRRLGVGRRLGHDPHRLVPIRRAAARARAGTPCGLRYSSSWAWCSASRGSSFFSHK